MRSERSNGSAAQHNSIERMSLPSDEDEAQSHPSCSLVDQPTTSEESGGQVHELHMHLAEREAGNTLGRRYGESTGGEEGARAGASVASAVLQLQMPATSQHREHQRPLRFLTWGRILWWSSAHRAHPPTSRALTPTRSAEFRR